MPIDPLSVATQGYIINNNPKRLFGITLATLGYIKPRITIEEVTKKKLGGSGGVAVGFKRRKEVRKEEECYDISIMVDLLRINNMRVSKEPVSKKYRNSYIPFNVEIEQLVYKSRKFNLHFLEVATASVIPMIKVENVRLMPIRTIVSSSVSVRTKGVRVTAKRKK